MPSDVDWSVVTPVMSPPASHRLARLTGAKMRSGDELSINTRIFSFSVKTDGDSEKMETSW